jgi:hypothetical protein
MSLRYTFARTGRGLAWQVRRYRIRRQLGRRGRERSWPDFRVRLRNRRQLARMERALARDTPALSSMFAMFNQLTRGERAGGMERIPVPAGPRLRPAYLAVLLALAALVTLCVTLSTHIRPAARPCLTTAGAGIGPHGLVRNLTCAAYANPK